MTWYFDPQAVGGTEWAEVEIYDHTGANVLTVSNSGAPRRRFDAQGIPVDPAVRDAILQYLKDRGEADIYALLGIAEALTGAGFEQGTPP